MVTIMDNENKKYTCCFFGHRKIQKEEEIKIKVYEAVENLIKDGVYIFLFGSKSEFNSLCYEIVSKLKEKYSHITRIYVRAEYQYIDSDYLSYLLKSYEKTYYPENIYGRAAYAERNREMIDNSDFCVVYYDENYEVIKHKSKKHEFVNRKPNSGTRLAFKYALKKKKKIKNVFL